MAVNSNKLETMNEGKLVLNMALPMIFSLLITSLYNIVDGIFVARYSEDALTATSLAYPMQMIMIAVGVGTAVGINAILSHTLGEKKLDEASQIAVTGLILTIVSSLVFMVIGIFFSGELTRAFTPDEDIAPLYETYLRINMIFCTGNLACMTFQRLLQATGRTVLSMVVLLSGAITNIILDPIMIFGYLGCPKMGIAGAAIATVIGQWVSFAVGIILNARKNPEVKITLKGYHFKSNHIKAIYRVGVPTMIMQGMTSIMVTAINAILQPFSTTAVAFFGVYFKLQNFLFMPMNGLGQALIPIVAYNHGANHSNRIKHASAIAHRAATIIALIGTVVFWIFGRYLLLLFSANKQMMEIGLPALRIISITFVFASYTMMTGYYASGLQNGMVNMIGAFLRQFVPLLPCAYILSRVMGMNGVWFSFCVSELCGFAYALIWRAKQKKHCTSAASTSQTDF